MITLDEMRKLEETSPIPVLDLMENAGIAVTKVLEEKFGTGKKILVVCHHGNNGGDGLVSARHLSNNNEVDVLFLGSKEKLKPEALTNFKRVEENNRIQFTTFEHDFNDYEIIIDAILGTGLSGVIRDPVRTVMKIINESSAKVISIDVPSGLHPDTGEEAEIIVKPDVVVALHDIKKGAEKFKDKSIIVDIGLNNAT